MTQDDIKEKILELNLEKYTSLERIKEDSEFMQDGEISKAIGELEALEQEQLEIIDTLDSTNPQIKAIMDKYGVSVEQFATGKFGANANEIMNVNLKVNGMVLATWSEEGGVWLFGGHAGMGFEGILRRLESIRNEKEELMKTNNVIAYQYALKEFRELESKEKLSLAEKIRMNTLKKKIAKLEVTPEVSRLNELENKNGNVTGEAVDNFKKCCEEVRAIGNKHLTAEQRAKAVNKKIKDNKKTILEKSVGNGYFEVLESYNKYKDRKGAKEQIFSSLPEKGYSALKENFNDYLNSYNTAQQMAKNDNRNFSRMRKNDRLNYYKFARDMHRMLHDGFGFLDHDAMGRMAFECYRKHFPNRYKHNDYAKLGKTAKEKMLGFYTTAEKSAMFGFNKTPTHTHSFCKTK